MGSRRKYWISKKFKSIFRGLAVFIVAHHMLNILLNVTLYSPKFNKLT